MSTGQYVSGWVLGLAIIAMVLGMGIHEYKQSRDAPWFIVCLFTGMGLLIIGGTILAGVA